MTAEDWQWAWLSDPILREVIKKPQDGTVGQWPLKSTAPAKLKQLVRECNHFKLRRGIQYQRVLPRGSQEALFQPVLPATHWEMSEICHDKVGHLGLNRMLDIMCYHFLWSQLAFQVKKHIYKCCQFAMFKAKQQRPPMESIVTHPLELVHIDYLCLELEKGEKRMSWWSLITLSGMHRLTPCGYILPKQLQKPCGTISSFTLDYQKRFCHTREVTLRVNWPMTFAE